MTERALSFGAVADAYDAHRPSYPAEALEWALGPAPLRVVDLGAGTGKLTRALVALGYDVVAVEPDDQMRARLADGSPGVTALAGSAEAIPLPDKGTDAVLAGQAYHWFDRERADPEIARVLRPGGVFAPLWNIRDESVPWVAELGRIGNGRVAGPSGIAAIRQRILDDGFGPRFSPVEVGQFRWYAPMTAARLRAMMATRSAFVTAPPATRAALDAEIGALVADFPEPFELPYVTEVYRAVRT